MGWIIAIVAIVLALVVAASMTPKTSVKPAALEDFELPTADDGRPIPVFFGTCWSQDANVLWYGDLRTTAIKSKGGK